MPQVVALVGVQEAFVDHAVEHRDQRRVEAVDVEERAGLVADAELAPGQHLEHLVQRAEAAGQGDETVGQVEHARLALVHRADDFQLRVTPLCATSQLTSCSGITPITSPPASSTASATTPIRPTLPPP